MKFIYMIAFLFISSVCTGAFADNAAPDSPSPQEQKLLTDCNLAARNSLINGDIAEVERTCAQAVKEMENPTPAGNTLSIRC